jgi:Ser/Thr protein kinase RdoA (MazF antagonist)
VTKPAPSRVRRASHDGGVHPPTVPHGGVHPPTYAAGVRLRFADLPGAVSSWVARVLGGEIVAAVDKQGGFSPGVAAVVTTSDGTSGFVKAVGTSINADSVMFHRAEAAVMATLPDAPTVLRPVASASLDVDGADWEVMIFPVIDGDPPRHPWTAHELDRVLDALADLSARFTPSPWPPDETRAQKLRAFFRGWTRIRRDERDPWSEHPWIAGRLDDLVALEPVLHDRLRGDTLSHCDLRADNVLVSPTRVWFVDWAHAGNAARWLDPVLLLCDVIASAADRVDGGEVDVPRLLVAHRAFAGVDPWNVWATIATLAATLHWFSRQPPPPALPTIRAYQELTAEALLRAVARYQPDGVSSPCDDGPSAPACSP